MDETHAHGPALLLAMLLCLLAFGVVGAALRNRLGRRRRAARYCGSSGTVPGSASGAS